MTTKKMSQPGWRQPVRMGVPIKDRRQGEVTPITVALLFETGSIPITRAFMIPAGHYKADDPELRRLIVEQWNKRLLNDFCMGGPPVADVENGPSEDDVPPHVSVKDLEDEEVFIIEVNHWWITPDAQMFEQPDEELVFDLLDYRPSLVSPLDLGQLVEYLKLTVPLGDLPEWTFYSIAKRWWEDRT